MSRPENKNKEEHLLEVEFEHKFYHTKVYKVRFTDIKYNINTKYLFFHTITNEIELTDGTEFYGNQKKEFKKKIIMTMKKKNYIFDMSETKTIKKALSNETIDWAKSENVELLEEEAYNILNNIALALGLDTKHQDSEKGLIAKNIASAIHFDSSMKMPHINITLESDNLKNMNNHLMKLIQNNDEYLMGFLNSNDGKSKLHTILPGNAMM